VPSVLTMPQTAAEQTLTDAGFQVVVKTGPSALDPGTVYKQQPKAGASAPAGSTVTIWVAQ
jgi:beta-lactam-binding protein with PASTA domain